MSDKELLEELLEAYKCGVKLGALEERQLILERVKAYAADRHLIGANVVIALIKGENE